MATANTKTEISSCCGVRVTYQDFTLVCKKCYNEVEWETETKTPRIGVPILIWSDVRQHIGVCGLDDELRGTYNALQYAQCLMSEIEFTEMYKAGSDIYRTASDVIVRVVNRKAGK